MSAMADKIFGFVPASTIAEQPGSVTESRPAPPTRTTHVLRSSPPSKWPPATRSSGLNEQFDADPNPAKVNLGVGVYYDENGKLPLLKCVQAAERQMAEAPKPRGYLPIDGIAAYDKAVQGLVFGADSAAVKAGRIATVQALGGTGGLKLGADFLKRLSPNAQVLISDPSWENHRALFTNAGFRSAPIPTTTRPRAASPSTPCWRR